MNSEKLGRAEIVLFFTASINLYTLQSFRQNQQNLGRHGFLSVGEKSLQPDRPFHNFLAEISRDRQILCSSIRLRDGFRHCT